MYAPMQSLADIARGVPEREERLAARRLKSSTRSACPCCAWQPSSPYHRKYRPADETCDDCLETLWRAQDALSADEKRRTAGGLEQLLIPRAWPYIFEPRFDHVTRSAVDRIIQVCRSVVWATLSDRAEVCRGWHFSMTFRHVKSHKSETGGSGDSGAVNAPAGTKEALEALPDIITAALIDIYEAGVARGKSLVTMLAAGEITLDELETGKARR